MQLPLASPILATMTDNEWKIIEIAIDIANRAPRKQGSYVHSAQIPWTLIDQLRDAIAANGWPVKAR